MKAEDRFSTKTGFALLAVDNENRQIVSVAWKETHTINADGYCTPAESQEPFIFDPAMQEEMDLQEPEIMPFKLATDLVVIGNAYAPGGKAVTQMTAAVEIDKISKEILVIGDRTCTYREGAPPLVSEPEPFQVMPICYERAYGGVDMTIEEQPLNSIMDTLNPPLGAYPRNDYGLGYALTNNPDRIEGLALPNLEDPHDRLSPERIIVWDINKWWQMPLPQSFDWFSPAWFPRAVYFGGIPAGYPADDRDVPEVQRGYIEPGLVGELNEKPFDQRLQLELANAASPGLILPYLKGNETILLKGMRPEGDWNIVLPDNTPHILLRYKDKDYPLETVPHTIIINTEEAKLTTIWRGSWRTIENLPKRLPHFKDPDVDPLEGIDIFVNGLQIH